MFFNYGIFIAIILGVILFYVGRRLSRIVNTRVLRMFLYFAFVLFCIPNFLFSTYYLHILDEPLWYVEFRSINNIEVLSSFVGLFFGFITFRQKSFGKINLTAFNKYIFIMCMLLILVPYIKPIILPIGRQVEFSDKWKDDVCLQSTSSTCGPASLATIFKYYGISKSEEEIARASFSCASGTENWYLIRYAKENGLEIKILNKNNLSDVPIPSIIGTYINGGIGHFVTVLGRDEEKIIIGDPLRGRLLLAESEFNKYYTFSKFILHMDKTNN